ncbi:MAG: hypothetical protein HC859_10760, partial [Bacteroidia bacterium]|nr:hypothetical protein [Bacteroidia bacterium]
MKTSLLFVLLFLVYYRTSAHPGVGIVEDSKGNIYYTDLSQVWKIDTEGRKSVAVPSVHTHELYIDAHDNLFGEHLWYEGGAAGKWGHYVWCLRGNGTFEKIIPATEGFLSDYSFVRDHTGTMFWADRSNGCQHVMAKAVSGNVSKHSDQCMTDIRWMATDKAGNVLVVDRIDLKRVDKRGGVSTLATNLPDWRQAGKAEPNSHAVMGVWTDDKGNIYTAIMERRMVKKVAPDGTISVVARTAVAWLPSGGLVSAQRRPLA